MHVNVLPIHRQHGTGWLTQAWFTFYAYSVTAHRLCTALELQFALLQHGYNWRASGPGRYS